MPAWRFWSVQILRLLLVAAAMAAGAPWPALAAGWLLLVLLHVEWQLADRQGVEPAAAPAAPDPAEALRARWTQLAQGPRGRAVPVPPSGTCWFVPDTSRRQH